MKIDKNPFNTREEDSLFELFHENTKLNEWSARAYGINVGIFNSSDQLKEVTNQPYKEYPLNSKVSLPLDFQESEVSLIDSIEKRRTTNIFNGDKVTLKELSQILRFSAGINHSIPSQFGSLARRSYPSAGAMFPLELYVVSRNVKNLEKGVYHYNVKDHSLEILNKEFLEDWERILFTDESILAASAVILISAIFHRTTLKYKSRGYRMLLFEAGHLAQNILLLSTSLSIGTCPIGGFLDNDVNEILGLDGLEESVIYPILIGKT